MMNRWKLTHLFILLVTTPVIAQEHPKPILAIIPDIQTAEWAKRWWMPRHEEKLRVKAEMKDVDLLLIGDSITLGFESGGSAAIAPRTCCGVCNMVPLKRSHPNLR